MSDYSENLLRYERLKNHSLIVNVLLSPLITLLQPLFGDKAPKIIENNNSTHAYKLNLLSGLVEVYNSKISTTVGNNSNEHENNLKIELLQFLSTMQIFGVGDTDYHYQYSDTEAQNIRFYLKTITNIQLESIYNCYMNILQESRQNYLDSIDTLIIKFQQTYFNSGFTINQTVDAFIGELEERSKTYTQAKQ